MVSKQRPDGTLTFDNSKDLLNSRTSLLSLFPFHPLVSLFLFRHPHPSLTTNTIFFYDSDSSLYESWYPFQFAVFSTAKLMRFPFSVPILSFHVVSLLNLQLQVLCRWILTVKRNYRPVIYHNWRHSLNVTQTMFAMLTVRILFCVLPLNCRSHKFHSQFPTYSVAHPFGDRISPFHLVSTLFDT